MKKIEISMEISVSNGEWRDGHQVSSSWEKSHVIDIDLVNDENTFQAAKDVWFREFEHALEKSVNQVIQRVLDNRPDKPVPGDAENEAGKK